MKRLTLITVFNDFILAVTDTERGFLKTVRDLSQQPGPMVKKYIEGHRASYLSAGKYTFFLVVLFTINISFIENHLGVFKKLSLALEKFNITDSSLHIGDSNKEEAPGIVNLGTREDEASKQKITLKWGDIEKQVEPKVFLDFVKRLLPVYHQSFFDYLKFFSISWLPIFSILSLFFFYRSPWNLAEHFTFNAFIFSHMLLIFIVISPAYWLVPQLSGTTFIVTSTAMLFFLFYSYMQFFNDRPRRLLKTGMIVGLGFSIFILLVSSLTIALAFYIGLKNIHLLS